MTLRNKVANVSCAAGVVCVLGGLWVFTENQTSTGEDRKFPAHTLFSELANYAGADINRYQYCDDRFGPSSRRPDPCEKVTIEYEGDSYLAIAAAYMPSGVDLGLGALLVGVGFGLYSSNRREEDYQLEPVTK